ncbi:hypothetical protein [Streptomyces sp. G-G2]|uniref:hypothetical protein n=1 Tax=Streptomyces sp. G-G2 TaxID=3046201 RepID=UPI0024BAF474|nr:hypothetical protein [Streptomyces sp. G-G2]MDJ0384551.1 hypothetical protein [Streptomyces sp. G-G2]
MNRLTLLAAGTAGLAVFAITPASATVQSAETTATVTSCGNAGLQAGLSTRLCADVTGTSVEFYGKVTLAGPSPTTKELITTLSVEVVGNGTPTTLTRSVIFNSAPLEIRGPVSTVPCGSTIRGTFGVAFFPRPAQPVVHEVTITC